MKLEATILATASEKLEVTVYERYREELGFSYVIAALDHRAKLALFLGTEQAISLATALLQASNVDFTIGAEAKAMQAGPFDETNLAPHVWPEMGMAEMGLEAEGSEEAQCQPN